jgi:hypothetical protein
MASFEVLSHFISCLKFISCINNQYNENKNISSLKIQNRAHYMKCSSASTQMVFKDLIMKVGPVFGHQQMLLKQDKGC